MSPNNCFEIQDRIIASRFDDGRNTADPTVQTHVATCQDCRQFATDCESIADGVHSLKANVFDRVKASSESRHRVHAMLDVWAAEEGMRRPVTGRKTKSADVEPWFARWFSWAFPASPTVASLRVIVQSVAAVGLVLFFAFIVHLSLSRRQMAEQPKKDRGSVNAPNTESQPTKTPVKKDVK